MAGKKTHYVDSDILVIGGGFGGCGAAYESRYWGRDKKIVVVEKASAPAEEIDGGRSEAGRGGDICKAAAFVAVEGVGLGEEVGHVEVGVAVVIVVAEVHAHAGLGVAIAIVGDTGD